MVSDPKQQLERMAKLTVIIAAVSALAFALAALSGCTTAAGASTRCAYGQERVRVGPRGQMPKYVCRDKAET